jgi:hypothetical protein
MAVFAIATVAVCLPGDFSTRYEDFEVLCSLANSKIEEMNIVWHIRKSFLLLGLNKYYSLLKRNNFPWVFERTRTRFEYSVTCVVITTELWDHDRAFLLYRSDQRYDGSSAGILNRICAVRNYLLRLLKVIESDDTPLTLYQKCALECISRVGSAANNADPDPRKPRKSTSRWSEIKNLRYKRAFADRILSEIQETRDDVDIIAITEDIYQRAKKRFSGGIDM